MSFPGDGTDSRAVDLIDWSPEQDRLWLSVSGSGSTELAWVDLTDDSLHGSRPRQLSQDMESVLWELPIDGTPERDVGRLRVPAATPFPLSAFSLHPDGTRLAFESLTGSAEEEWEIVNLLQFIQTGATHRSPPTLR